MSTSWRLQNLDFEEKAGAERQPKEINGAVGSNQIKPHLNILTEPLKQTVPISCR